LGGVTAEIVLEPITSQGEHRKSHIGVKTSPEKMIILSKKLGGAIAEIVLEPIGWPAEHRKSPFPIHEN
jgi:hypothetical protein